MCLHACHLARRWGGRQGLNAWDMGTQFMLVLTSAVTSIYGLVLRHQGYEDPTFVMPSCSVLDRFEECSRFISLSMCVDHELPAY